MAQIEIEQHYIPQELQATIDYAKEMAKDKNLSPQQTQMLVNFANLNFRILDIETDFCTTDWDNIRYPLGLSSNGAVITLGVGRPGHSKFVGNLKLMAFNLYESALKDTEETKTAASDVVDFIKYSFAKQE